MALAVTLILALPTAQPAAQAPFVFFNTPSHNIGCMYSTRVPRNLRCDIVSGLEPPPPRPRGCRYDWRYGYQLGARGLARTVCASDTVVAEHSDVVRYGQTWRGGPFVCTARTRGLRCRNLSGHGFFLSRGRSFRF